MSDEPDDPRKPDDKPQKKPKKKSYTAVPAVPESLSERYAVMMAVLSGAISVSEGARQLKLSRNHFQTQMHKALEGFIERLSPKPPGPRGRTETEQRLLDENAKLQRDNLSLQARVDTIDRMLGVASQLLRERMPPRARARQPRPPTPSTSSSSTTSGTESPRDPGDDGTDPLGRTAKLRTMGLRAPLVAAMAGVGASTLRRWRAGGLPLRARRTRRAPLDRDLAAKVDAHVRALRGLVGAESIRHSIDGVSRRQAAAVKRETLTAIERERVERADRVWISAAGVVRGFDQMYVNTTVGQQLLLVHGDGSVAYRTSIVRTEHYDEQSVAAAVERDFALHGAPLVWRADRHRSHDTPSVRELLRAHGVLRLQGPPRHPGFYGQTERQNREHRAWLDVLGVVDPDALDEECEHMLAALNGAWKRPTLAWRTAHDAWAQRPRLDVNRNELREEVTERADRIRRHDPVRGVAADLAERLAIEQVLTTRGFLRREAGGWC
jgi:hypothetical protein